MYSRPSITLSSQRLGSKPLEHTPWLLGWTRTCPWAMMEQMSKFMEHLKRLEESCAVKDERIRVLEGKVEEGEQTLSRCVNALELLSVKVCRCNDDVVALGSGAIKESSELEYASEY